MYNKLNFYLFSILLCLIMVGCEDKEPPTIPSPTLKNGMVTEVNRFGATLSGTINYSSGVTIKEFGLAYSLLASMPLEETERIVFSSKESGVEQKVKLVGLTPATKYYYRLYATNGYSEIFSEQQTFETTTDDVATFGQVVLMNVTENEATVKCNFMDQGGTAIKEYGFAYRKKNSSEEEKQIKATNKDNAGFFSATITGLEHSTEYEVRAFAINSKGTGHSDPLVMSTSVPVAPKLGLSIVKTTYNSITLSAVLQNEKEVNGITEVGFYWGKEVEALTDAGNHVIAKLENGKFEVELKDLEQSTTYYAKAYAINKTVKGESEVVSATTARSVVPVLSELTVVSVAEEAITLSGKITDFGGHEIKSMGYTYQQKDGQSNTGTIPESSLNTDGTFKFTITGLHHSTEYQIRAFAENEAGNGYSEYIKATTATPSAPVLVMTASADGHQKINLSATVQNPDVANGITEVGFYWSKKKEDLVSGGTQVIAKLEKQTFKTTLSGLEQNTTYYIKAYAINKTVKGESEIVSATTARSVVPVLSQLMIESVTEETVTLSGKITDKGGHEIKSMGYTYQVKEGQSNTGSIPLENLKADGTFKFTITGLHHSTEYQIRAYATNVAGNGYSEYVKATTATPSAPVLVMTASADGHQKINLSATVQNPDVANGITEVGFYWSKKKEDLVSGGTQVIAKLEKQTFKTTLSGLEQNTTYYIKAYAINKTVKGVSEVVSATTARSAVPVISELKLVSASEKALVVSGKITDKGGHEITEIGFLYQKPNSADEVKNKVSLDKLNQDGTFQFTVAGLEPGLTYQIRAYAMNQVGTGYSAYASLATATQNEPKLEIQVGAVTANSIALSAAVTDKGSNAATLTETGFVYSTSNTSPTILDNKVRVEGANDTYTTVLQNLQQGVTYYVRAYAKNDTKTGYSEVKEVKTSRSSMPSVDKVTMGTITENSATVIGKILDNGNNNLTAIGFSYKTKGGSEMQVSVNLADLGNDNTFKATLTGLSASTDYQVRAYATNKEGTGYGEYVDFKTTDLVSPKLTVATDSIDADFVNLSAVIQSVGKEGSTIGEVGFCWSTTNQSPTISDSSKKAELKGMNFAVTLSSLKPETTYYIRAYATNESTMGYSNVLTVKTLASDKPSIDDNPSPDIK